MRKSSARPCPDAAGCGALEMCERARADAFAHAVEHATALGANALLAVRYDATEIMTGVAEVLCYGTAVRVAPRLRGRSD